MTRHTSSYFSYRTPHGPLTVGVNNEMVTCITRGATTMEGACKPSALSNLVATQLLEYFAGKRQVFDLPLAPQGTPFQQAVWNELAHIPYAETRTSSDIAYAIGKPKSFRMVGNAISKNPLFVVVPSHRIVGVNGRTLGSGTHAQIQHALLEFERAHQCAL